MKKFLILKSSSIGDVLQTLDVVSYLKKRFPLCQVDWIVEKRIAPLLKAHPLIDRVLEIDTKLWRRSPWRSRREIGAAIRKIRQVEYNALFDLQGNIKSGCFTLLAKAIAKVGWRWKDLPEKLNYLATNIHIEKPEDGSVKQCLLALVQEFFSDKKLFTPDPFTFVLTQQEESKWEEISLKDVKKSPIIVSFGSNWPSKMVSEETLISFLKKIVETFDPFFYLIYGNPKEQEMADRIVKELPQNGHSLGGLTLPLLQRLMATATACIGVDSALLHLCATTTTPSFSLFGPSSAKYYKPEGDRHVAFQGSCPYGIRFKKRCPKLRSCLAPCLKRVDPDALFDRFSSFWKALMESSSKLSESVNPISQKCQHHQ